MKRFLFPLFAFVCLIAAPADAQETSSQLGGAKHNAHSLKIKHRDGQVFQVSIQTVEGVLKHRDQNILFETDFSDGIDDWIVYGEGEENWYPDNWGLAGGEGDELTLDYDPEFDGESYMTSPIINTTGYTALNFEYKFFLWYYDSEVTIGVYTTIDDGENWLTVWEQAVTEDLGPELQSLVIDNEHVGNENFRFAFGFSGNCYNIMGYFVDDVVLSAAENHDLAVIGISPILFEADKPTNPVVTIQNLGGNAEDTWSVTLTNGAEYVSTVENVSALQVGEVINVSMDEWTPAQGKYMLTATVNLAGDGNQTNNTYSTEIIATQPIETFVWSLYVETPNPQGVTGEGPISLFLPEISMEQIVDNTNDEIFAAEYVKDELYGFLKGSIFKLAKINPKTGAVTAIGGGIEDARGLAYDITTGITYAVDLEGVLYTINLTDGQATVVGGGYPGMQSLVCDNEGNLYAISYETDDLVSIDKVTGEATPIGLLGLNIVYKQEIAYDRDNDVMYGILSTEVSDRLYILNKSTGHATFVQGLGVEAGGFAIPYTYSGNHVDNLSDVAAVYAYPNPTSGIFSVAVNGEFEVKIFDITGRFLTTGKVNSNENSIDLSQYSSGLYIIKLMGSTSHTLTVVKQ